MGADRVLVLTGEVTPELMDCLEKLSKLKAGLPGELVDRFLSFLEGRDEMISIDSDFSTTAGADECRIALQPSDLLREFMSTLARDYMYLIVE